MATLSVVVCGAPLAVRASDVRAAAETRGWQVTITTTAAAAQWWTPSADEVVQDARHPDALLVCPMTFNTASKWALGISDNRAMGLLNEALGSEVPRVAVPMVNDTLWRHPAWEPTLQRLISAGVRLVDPSTGVRKAAAVLSGTGERVSAAFEPAWVLDLLPPRS